MDFERSSDLVREALDVGVEDLTPVSWMTIIVRDTLGVSGDEAKPTARRLLEWMVADGLVDLHVSDPNDRSQSPRKIGLAQAKDLIGNPATWEPDSRNLSVHERSHG